MTAQKGGSRCVPSQTGRTLLGSSSPTWKATVRSPSFPRPPWPRWGLHRESEDLGGDRKSGPSRATSDPGIQLPSTNFTHLAVSISGFSLLVLKKSLLQINTIDNIQCGQRGRETGISVPCWRLCKLMYLFKCNSSLRIESPKRACYSFVSNSTLRIYLKDLLSQAH